MTPTLLSPAIVWDASTIWIFIPLGGMGIGLIAMMLGHQQNMAKIVRGQADEGTKMEIEGLRQELRELKAMVSQAIRVPISAPQELGESDLDGPSLRATLRE